jgi:hypothetical protein
VAPRPFPGTLLCNNPHSLTIGHFCLSLSLSFYSHVCRTLKQGKLLGLGPHLTSSAVYINPLATPHPPSFSIDKNGPSPPSTLQLQEQHALTAESKHQPNEVPHRILTRPTSDRGQGKAPGTPCPRPSLARTHADVLAIRREETWRPRTEVAQATR